MSRGREVRVELGALPLPRKPPKPRVPFDELGRCEILGRATEVLAWKVRGIVLVTTSVVVVVPASVVLFGWGNVPLLELEGRANGAAEGKFEFAAVALGLLPALGMVVMFELGLCGVPVNDGAAEPNIVVPG